MATLEDKILGEKLQNYCSSSSEDSDSDSEEPDKAPIPTEELALPEPNKWEGTSSNTGPKGVLKDWQRYKQLENEKREQDDQEKIALMKKLTLTVQTAMDEEREKAAENDPDLAELLNDEFLVNYQKQRMREMLEQSNRGIKYGRVIFLESKQDFLFAIDVENKSTTVIVHIYDENNEACRTMSNCLKQLSELYIYVKFCEIKCLLTGLSRRFKREGVPALLIYKSGQLIGNFIRLSNDLGNDFHPEDVQTFLVEHGMIEDKNSTPLLIKSNDIEDSE